MFRRSQGNGEVAKTISNGSNSSKKRWSWRKRNSRTYELFSRDNPEETVPAVGGLNIKTPLPENLLPPEALLYTPSDEMIRNNEIRMIHLNSPLLTKEQKQLKELDEECRKQSISIPRSMQTHSLRVLQQHKGNAKKALEQLRKNYEFRMTYLPIAEADVLDDLHKGWMYWHGRDKRCRPILVVRAGRMDKEVWANPDRITRLVLFLLEFILRYGMVPGRVENWCVLVDLTGSGKVTPSMTAVKSMAHAMQGIYRFRMAWTKILNAPWSFSMFWTALKAVLPGESVKKVEICSADFKKSLANVAAANQLEERYGGSCRDREAPQDFYPMFFPPGPFDPEAGSYRSVGSPRGGAKTDISRILHNFTPMTLHEGGLWIEGQEETWLPRARLASLTKDACDHLKASSIHINPCETYQDLLNLLHQSQEDITDAPSDDFPKSSPVTSRTNEEVPIREQSSAKELNAKGDALRESLRATATSGVTLDVEKDRKSTRLSEGSRVSVPRAEQLSREREKLPSRERERKSQTTFVEVKDPVTGGIEKVEMETLPEIPVIGSRERERDLGDGKDTYGTCHWCSCRPCGR